MENRHSQTQIVRPKRRYDIDWLRVIAVLMLIPFHAACIFEVWDAFYAKNAEISTTLSYVVIVSIHAWHMPLFFLLAGASTWFALEFRSGKQYVSERLKRLLFPLIFGVLVIVPPQTYFGAMTYGYFRGSYWEYYPQFFQTGPTGDLTGYMGGFTPGHLWFILFLLVLSLVGLPLFLWLKRKSGRYQLERLGNFLARPGMIYFLALPLLATLFLPDIGGKNPFYYFVFFAYGYILMSNKKFTEIIDQHKSQALILGPVTLAIFVILGAGGLSFPPWSESLVDLYLSTIVSWCCLIAILGYSQRKLNFTNRILQYASEGAYPFYILHQTVVVAIGYFLVQWRLEIFPKYLMIVVASLLGTALLYELAIRRFNLIRFLFGMKPRQTSTPPVTAKSRLEDTT